MSDHIGHPIHYGQRRLRMALAINAVFLVVEVAGGLAAGSLALLADAGHMLADVAALTLAVIVAALVEREPTPRWTFGLVRAEALGAFVNGAGLVVVVAGVFHEAWNRMGTTSEIDAPLMTGIAILGLAANALSAWVLFGSRDETLNIRGAFLHLAGDTLGSVGAIVVGVVVWTTGWTLIDPIAAVIIGVLILWSSWSLIAQTSSVLLDAVPDDIDPGDVRRALLDVAHVVDVHDLHIRTIATGLPDLSAHVTLDAACADTTHWQHCLLAAQTMLRERFGIVHTTLQIEPRDYERDGRPL